MIEMQHRRPRAFHLEQSSNEIAKIQVVAYNQHRIVTAVSLEHTQKFGGRGVGTQRIIAKHDAIAESRIADSRRSLLRPHKRTRYNRVEADALPTQRRTRRAALRNAFLIRHPASVLASYALKRDEVTLADIGFVQQRELFEAEADRMGKPPPVVDAADIVANPARTLERLCHALGIPYCSAMLRWQPGRRTTDGVWAPAWYQSVEKSTGFQAPTAGARAQLPPRLCDLADRAWPHYAALEVHRLF